MKELDFNILIALDVLLREQSVTVAAEKMAVSVPTMSRTLKKARKMMKDPLLIRAGLGMVPTVKAVVLQPRLASLMSEAKALMDSGSFSPLRESDRIFTIRTDDAFICYADRITTLLQQTAPKLRLRFLTKTEEEFESLREGLVHLDIGITRTRNPEIKVQKIFRQNLIGVAPKDHPLFAGKITPRRYAGYQHVNASRRGSTRTPIDLALEKLGISRNISLVVPSFQAALFAAVNSQLLAALPRFLSQTVESLGLRVFEIPVATPDVTIWQAWHPRFDYDPAHKLLRQSVLKACCG